MNLRTKLTAAFIIVVLLATSIVAIVSTVATKKLFQNYINDLRLAREKQWLEVLASFYAESGSWNGVQELLVIPGRYGMGRHMMGARMGMISGDRLLIFDSNNFVVGDSDNEALGAVITYKEVRKGTAVIINNNIVGTVLLKTNPPEVLVTLEQIFSRSASTAILGGGIVASILAMGLGIWYSRRITSPIIDLTKTTKKISRRELFHRVEVRGGDEIGELSKAFNNMIENLEHSEALRKNLVADVAHELRTPLTILRGNLESLQDGALAPSPEVIISLHDEVLRMTRLVGELQELSLAEAGKLTLHLEPVNIIGLLEKVVEPVRNVAAMKNITLKFSLENSLPLVNLDQDRVSQVLLNILNNALQHTPEGGVIHITVSKEENFLFLSVQDTGSGILPEALPFIFERFYRGDKSRTRSGGGTGLGLAIAKGFVEAHGGRIWAENATNGGTVFHFSIPLS